MNITYPFKNQEKDLRGFAAGIPDF